MMKEKEKLSGLLLTWYDAHARILPWRSNPAPYRVWVSEIMLQQTRVAAVMPYFERFMKELPDVYALADCPEDKLMKLWEGLGYYHRVMNMKKTAGLLVENYNGVLPDTVEELITLPGIGSYTAGAIASIAFGKAAPAVDGNVLRVMARLTGNTEDITKDSTKKKTEAQVMELMDKNRAGDFTQAIIELGALVCLPGARPECACCPFMGHCAAQQSGQTDTIPVKSSKKKRKIEERTVFVIQDGESTALHKRPEHGLLAGLYELLNVSGHLSEDEAIEAVKAYGFEPLRITAIGEAKHIFTHIEWHMTGYKIRVAALEKETAGIVFVRKNAVEETYAVPTAFSRYMEYLK